MNFYERREFLCDPEVFKRSDTTVALKIHAEYVRRHSARPAPRFFEVNREASGQLDDLWHVPTADRTPFSRELDIPAINQFEKPDWRLTKLGIIPQRRDRFWLAYNILAQLDYFPNRGDQVFWNGYRYLILKVVIPPESYWQQTNVWLGLTVECAVPPEGDNRPLVELGKAAQSEMPDNQPPPEIPQGL